MGNPVAMDGQQSALQELKKIKNVAMVMVSATVPATGARRGDQVDCFVSAINGKSLEGGRLAFASLKGPNTQDQRVYALCEGQVTIDNPTQPMVGIVHGGCQIEADMFTPFYRDGYMTLVLDKNHADFQTANEIVYSIRKQLTYSESGDAKQEDMVRAIDASNIVVRIPDVYTKRPGRICLGPVGNPDRRAADGVARGDQSAGRNDRDQRRRGDRRRDRVAQERGRRGDASAGVRRRSTSTNRASRSCRRSLIS